MRLFYQSLGVTRRSTSGEYAARLSAILRRAASPGTTIELRGLGEGRAIAETLYNNNPIKMDHADVPTAVFSALYSDLASRTPPRAGPGGGLPTTASILRACLRLRRQAPLCGQPSLFPVALAS